MRKKNRRPREIASGIRARPHELTPWARVTGTSISYPVEAAADRVNGDW